MSRLVEISDNGIVRYHRIDYPGDWRHKDIIVKFMYHRTKAELMDARKKLSGSGIYINEDLTSLRTKLTYNYKDRCLKRQ